MREVCAHSNQKNDNIVEKGYGGDNKVKYSLEGFVASSKHRNTQHPYQSSKIEAYKTQGSGAGSKEKVRLYVLLYVLFILHPTCLKCGWH